MASQVPDKILYNLAIQKTAAQTLSKASRLFKLLSSLSHHYSRHKALVSLKPLLDFLLPTSAYQQASLPSFTTHKLGGGGGGETTDVWKIQSRRQCSLQQGTEIEGNNYIRLPKLSSLADSEAGCKNWTSKVSVPGPLPRQNTERSCNAWISFGQFRSEGKIHPAGKCSQNQV